MRQSLYLKAIYGLNLDLLLYLERFPRKAQEIERK